MGTLPASKRDQAEWSNSSNLGSATRVDLEVLDLFSRLEVDLRSIAGTNPLGDFPAGLPRRLAFGFELTNLGFSATDYQVGKLDLLSPLKPAQLVKRTAPV